MSRFHNTLLDLVFTSESENERRSAFKTLISTEFDGDLVFEQNGQKFNVVLGAIERPKRSYTRRAPKAAKAQPRKNKKRRAAKLRTAVPSKDDFLTRVKNYLSEHVGNIDARSSLRPLADDAKKVIHGLENEKKIKVHTKEQIFSKAYALSLAVMADDRKAVEFATHLLFDGRTKGMRIANNRGLATILASAIGNMAGIHMDPQQVKRAFGNLIDIGVQPSKLEGIMKKNRLSLYSLTNDVVWIKNRIAA